MAAPLQNVYYERKVGTAKPCYICRRETTTVLATLKTEDFLYTCDGHLSDSASLISAPSPAPAGPTADDIKKVIADYQAREAKKAEKAKGDDDKDKDGGKEKNKKDEPASHSKPASPGPPVGPLAVPTSGSSSADSAPSTSTHKKYALHRQIFEMRKMELKRKEQGVKAREVSKGLPQVPRGNF